MHITILKHTARAALIATLCTVSACTDSPAPASNSPAPAATTPAPKPIEVTESAPPGPNEPVPESKQQAQETVTITNIEGQYSAKELEDIIQHLEWASENFTSKHERLPKSLEELKAWKDPNYPLGMASWPKPPAGKKWAMNPNNGRISLEEAK